MQTPQMDQGVIRVEAATGDLRLHEFRSRIFRNTRFLRLWLPPGYDDPGMKVGATRSFISMMDKICSSRRRPSTVSSGKLMSRPIV